MSYRIFTYVAICIGMFGLLVTEAAAEEITAPLNGIESFETSSAVSDTLKVAAPNEREVRAIMALKVAGHPNSRITVITEADTGDVHVADVILRDGDSAYKVFGVWFGGLFAGGAPFTDTGFGGWESRYEHGPSRLGLYVNTTSPNDNYVGLGGEGVKTATVTVYVANTTQTTTGYTVTLSDQSGGGEVGFLPSPLPGGNTCTLGKIGGEDYKTLDLSGITQGATIIEATATGLTTGETDAFVTPVAFTDKDGVSKGEYYIGDDDIFVTVWGAAGQADKEVHVTDQTGGSGDTVKLTLTEDANKPGAYRNTPNANGYGLVNDNLMSGPTTAITADPGIAANGSVITTDKILKTDYGRNIKVTYGTQAITSAIELRENLWPSPNAPKIAQNFGVHEHVGGPEVHHTGIDIPQATNSGVYIVQNGRVTHVTATFIIVKSVYKINSTNMCYLLMHIKDGATLFPNNPNARRAHVYAIDGITRNLAGKIIGAGNNGGGTFNHVHLLTAEGPTKNANGTKWLTENFVNPLKYAYDNLDPAGNDPSLGPAFFRIDGKSGALPADYLAANNVHGKVDIAVEAMDDMGGEIAIPAAKTAEGLRQGIRSIPYKLEYAIEDAGGNLVKPWVTSWAFSRYAGASYSNLFETNKLVQWGTPEIRKQGYVFLVTHANCDNSGYWDTRAHGNGNYKVKVRVTDLAGNTTPEDFPVTLDNPLITVQDKTILKEADNQTVVVTLRKADGTVRATETFNVAITSDATKLENVAWTARTTDANGQALINIDGKAVGDSNLTVSFTEGGTTITGTGKITVTELEIEVPPVSVYVGETKEITVTVKDGASAPPNPGVTLAEGFLDHQKATIVFANNPAPIAKSDANGHVKVKVTGIAAGTTDLRLKDTGATVTGTGVVTVKGLVVTVPDAIVTMGGQSCLTINVKDTDNNPVEGVTLSVELLDPLKATNNWLISTTASTGNGWLDVTGVSAGQTLLRVKATINGATAIGEATITIELPVITVESVATSIGGSCTARIEVKDHYGDNLDNVALEIVAASLDQEKATAVWLTEAHTLEGAATVTVTGVDAGTTTLKIKATASKATGEGTITVVKINAVTTTPASIPANGTATSTVSSTTTPAGRTPTWIIVGDKKGCTINAQGVITAGQQAGQIIVRATDTPSGATLDGGLTLTQP